MISVDLREIRRVPSLELVEQLELLMSTLKTRGRGDINSVVRRQEGGVILESCLEDQPFLVSSLRALFGAERLEIASLMNAVIKVRRDAAGNLTSIGMGAPESVIRADIRARSTSSLTYASPLRHSSAIAFAGECSMRNVPPNAGWVVRRRNRSSSARTTGRANCSCTSSAV